MTAPPHRPFFQIHLSTAIVLMFAAGGLIWANVTPRNDTLHSNLYPGPGSGNDVITECRLYGWPFYAKRYAVKSINSLNTEMRWEGPRDWPLRYEGVIEDSIVALIILSMTCYGCESWIRHRESRKES